MPYDPHISYHGDEYLYQAITGAASDIGKNLAKAQHDYEETQKQKALGEETINFAEQQGDPSITTEFKNKYAQSSHSQQQGMITALAANVLDRYKKQTAADEHDLAQAHAQAYRAAAAKSAAAPDDPTIYLTAEERAAAAKAGKIPLRTSAGSFQYADEPEVDTADLDSKGNPIYSADGTMYKSGNKYKPVTAPMVQAHAVFKALEQADKATATQVKKQPGFSILHPTTWFGGGSSGPAQVQSKADYDALPSGATYTAPDGSIRTKK